MKKKKYTYQFEKDAADRRARLIEIGALTSEGEVPVYPMDHLPFGPGE